MNLLNILWGNSDRKYVSNKIVKFCWIKAEILLPTLNSNIENNSVCTSFPKKGNFLIGNILNDIFKMMNYIKLNKE